MAAWVLAPALVGKSSADPLKALAVAVPVSVDRPLLPLLGRIDRLPAAHPLYLAILLLSTDEACEAARAAGLPASVADIQMDLDGERFRCRVAQEGMEVVLLEARRRALSPLTSSLRTASAAHELSGPLLTASDDRLMEWEWSLGPLRHDSTPGGRPPRLVFGPHPLGGRLQSLMMGRAGRLDYYAGPAGGKLVPRSEALG